LKSELNPERASLDALLSRDVGALTSAEFLTLLDRKNIHLQARDEHLTVNAPAGVIDDHLRAELKRRKADLLILLCTAKEVTPKSPLVAVRRGGRIPMTPSQQGMWVIDHFDPGNVAYNIPEAFLFKFPLDLEVLQRSVDLLIARHEILRSSFHEEDGELYQTIAAEAHTEVGFTDLRSLSEAEAASRCRALIREHAHRPFDLRCPPLVRLHFFRVTPDRDVLLINIHHIIADLQALFVLREELMVCYQAFSAKTTPNLPELSLHFADYAHWADQQLRDGTMDSQIQYWREKLAGLPAFLELPISGKYPEKRSTEGAKVALVVPSAVRESLTRIGRECGATPFMTFLAGFAVLIARFSGQHDFCIGSPVTQRTRVETQRMIGVFMNLVAFRVQIAPQHSFREIVRQVRTTALEAYEQRDVPFQTLVRALRFNRRSPRSPIFQVMFGFEPASPADPSFWQFDSDPGTARYDLSLLLSESADGNVYGFLEYRTDIFEETEIAALAGRFVDLLREVADDPDRPGVSRPLVNEVMPVVAKSEAAAAAPIAPRPTIFGRLSKVFSANSDKQQL
jgi:Condensation domain/TubC N-terminal docking domain